MSLSSKLTSIAGALIALAFSSLAVANPVDVSYTVQGSAGNWLLDFSVTNNLNPSDMAVYLFGVAVDSGTPANDPSTFDSTVWPTWDNSPYGGSSTIVYNNVWIDETSSSLLPGQTQSDFTVASTDAKAPTDVSWFAFAVSNSGAAYNGAYDTNLGVPTNPGFEGDVTSVPEADTYALLGLGMGLVAFVARRRQA